MRFRTTQFVFVPLALCRRTITNRGLPRLMLGMRLLLLFLGAAIRIRPFGSRRAAGGMVGGALFTALVGLERAVPLCLRIFGTLRCVLLVEPVERLAAPFAPRDVVDSGFVPTQLLQRQALAPATRRQAVFDGELLITGGAFLEGAPVRSSALVGDAGPLGIEFGGAHARFGLRMNRLTDDQTQEQGQE